KVVAGQRAAATGIIPVGEVGKSAPARPVGVAGSIESDDRRVKSGDRARGGEVSGGTAPDDPSRSRPPDRTGVRPDHRPSGAFSVWEAGCQLCGTGTARKVQRETAALGAHHETREFDRTLSAGGSGPSCRTRQSSVAQPVFASTDAPRTKDGESSDGAPISHTFVLDVA